MFLPKTRLPILVAGLALGALAFAPEAKAQSNGCEAAKALTLIGKAAPPDAEVKALTGARTVRRVAPGDAATLDYRPDRVTLEIDKGQVTSTRCG